MESSRTGAIVKTERKGKDMESREQYTGAIVKVDDLRGLGSILAQSGYFQDAKDEAKAIVKVLAGQELGLGPIASMTGIHIINGKPAIGAALMAALVKRSKRYDFRVKTLTDKVAEIEFLEHGQPLGVSTFSEEDAKRASTQNMGKYPRNMLYARAMSNGVRWFCPDVLGGPVYEPGELGAEVDYETGEVIDGSVIVSPAEHEPAKSEPNHSNGRPWGPETLREMLNKKADYYRRQSDAWRAPPLDGLRGAMVGELNKMCGGEDGRHTFLRIIFGDPSSQTMDHAAVQAVLDWMNKDAEMAQKEAAILLKEANIQEIWG